VVGIHNVLVLPGVVLPAEQAYGALLAALGDDVHAVVKDLELYGGEVPPLDYDLDVEINGILREARMAGFDRFHLCGYSGGGAAALAFAARHGDRLLSLGLLEPAWAGSVRSASEQALHEQFVALGDLPAETLMVEFVRLQVAPGVEPPPRNEPSPPWMATRPAGIKAMIAAFDKTTLDLDALRRFEQPVYFALGGLSNPDSFAQMAERLTHVFSDFTLEIFPERHHFDPPHRSEPDHLASSLLALWQRAEGRLH
jgi:pimeloyl-ACP methyl ester carboxylesterase